MGINPNQSQMIERRNISPVTAKSAYRSGSRKMRFSTIDKDLRMLAVKHDRNRGSYDYDTMGGGSSSGDRGS